ncbi:MAG: HD domain-containing protein [Candidatus Gracilibacteria bacterium]
MTYSTLKNLILSKRPDIAIFEIARAYEFAKKAHMGQKRFSGEAYVEHPLQVAQILLGLNPDLATLQASILHDIPENTDVSLFDIEKEFGREVAILVEGVAKLSLVKIRPEDNENAEAERWRRLFLALAKDVRIVLIKLADRIHNMRTLEFVPAEKRERIARETLLVYSAVASRLGIYSFKSELEDLAFFYLYPKEFSALSGQLAEYRKKSKECMAYATSQVKKLLKKEGIPFKDVQGRMKHLFSIFQKMEKKDAQSFESIYDVFAVRIVLPDLPAEGKEKFAHIYHVLSLLHGAYEPLPDRLKDYIAVPKQNGYQSLHTTVLGVGGDVYAEPTEIQIRTLGMHEQAEIGVASHWSYKLGLKKGASSDEEDDQVFVLTPKKALMELPRGATPIDFAYSVHTEVGNKMVGARVNGKVVPLEYELKSGEVVEIITRNNGKPSQYWESIAKTSSARNKIRNYFKGLPDAVENIDDKKDLVLLENTSGKKKNKVVALEEDSPLRLVKKVIVSGLPDLPVTLSACCKPRPPSPIVAYVTRGHFLRIHRLSCRCLAHLDGDRFISAGWKK